MLHVEDRLLGGAGDGAAVGRDEAGVADEERPLVVVVEPDVLDDRPETLRVGPDPLVGDPGEVLERAVAGAGELLRAGRDDGRDVDVRGGRLAGLHVPQHGPGEGQVPVQLVAVGEDLVDVHRRQVDRGDAGPVPGVGQDLLVVHVRPARHG